MTADLQAGTYANRVQKNPAECLPPLQRITKRTQRGHTFGKWPEPLARESPAIQDELDGKWEGEEKGHRFNKWTFLQGVEGSLIDRITEKLEAKVQTSFYLRYSYTYRLCNEETGAVILNHKTVRWSP